jgi:nucleoside-diphosphate-sugar epimerase
MSERVLITGGSGFIGTNMVEHCRAHGAAVESWDIRPPQKADHAALWRPVDVGDGAAVAQALRRFAPTHVVHLAARTDLAGRNPSEYDVNVSGTENVLAAIERGAGVRHAVLASSRLVCRLGYEPADDDDFAPDTAYGESKARMEGMIRESRLSLPWTIARPTSIWGPWFGTPYRDFFLSVARSRYLHPRGVVVRKSFGYVGNTVHQLRELGLAQTEQVADRTFYVADYEPLDVLEFANAIRAALGRSRVPSVPLGILRGVAAAGDVAARIGVREPLLTSFRLRNLVTPMVYDTGPLREVVGPLLPHTVGAGIDVSLGWLRKQRLL